MITLWMICFPTPVLTNRFKGSGFTFSTPMRTMSARGPPANECIFGCRCDGIQKALPHQEGLKHHLHLIAPYAGLNRQVQRVRFYLLNSEESPCVLFSIAKPTVNIKKQYLENQRNRGPFRRHRRNGAKRLRVLSRSLKPASALVTRRSAQLCILPQNNGAVRSLLTREVPCYGV